MNERIDLDSLEETFQRIKRAYASECDKIPDGNYKVLVKYVELETSKNGIPQLMWVLEIISGEYASQPLYRYNTITDSENTLRLLDADLKRCGIKIEKIVDLQNESVLQQLLNIVLLVQVVNKDPGRNIYILKRLDGQRQPEEKKEEEE